MSVSPEQDFERGYALFFVPESNTGYSPSKPKVTLD
jgi:hypothetical protein